MGNFITVVGDALMYKGMIGRTEGRAEIAEQPFIHDLGLPQSGRESPQAPGSFLRHVRRPSSSSAA